MTFAIDIGRCPAVPHSLGTGTVGQSDATNDYNDLALSRCPTPRDDGTAGQIADLFSLSRLSQASQTVPPVPNDRTEMTRVTMTYDHPSTRLHRDLARWLYMFRWGPGAVRRHMRVAPARSPYPRLNNFLSPTTA